MLGLDRIDKKYQIGIIIFAVAVLVVAGIRIIPKHAGSSDASSQGFAVSCMNPKCGYQGSITTKELWKLIQDTNARLQYADQVPPFGMAMMMGWGSEEGPLVCPQCQQASLLIAKDGAKQESQDQ
jgi:hypothetical protein